MEIEAYVRVVCYEVGALVGFLREGVVESVFSFLLSSLGVEMESQRLPFINGSQSRWRVGSLDPLIDLDRVVKVSKAFSWIVGQLTERLTLAFQILLQFLRPLT